MLIHVLNIIETLLNKYNIGAVLTVADNTELHYVGRSHMIIPVDDCETENL